MPIHRLRALAAAALIAACQVAPDTDAADPGTAELCSAAERIATLPEPIAEASGIVASRTHAGTLWVHNDSERRPTLYALDADGQLRATLAVTGSPSQDDWEDIALGPCPRGRCLYIGDIGDNLHQREDRAILRLQEPEPVTGSVGPVERFPFSYPGGPEDAEAIFVMPDTTVFIVTKGRSRPVTLYRYPPPLRPDERVTLEKMQELTPGLVQLPEQVTGADALPDGSRVVLRTYAHLQLYSMDADTLAPLWPAPGFDLVALAEPQGEGVAILPEGTIYLVSETGPLRQPAPLARLHCPLQ